MYIEFARNNRWPNFVYLADRHDFYGNNLYDYFKMGGGGKVNIDFNNLKNQLDNFWLDVVWGKNVSSPYIVE